MLLCVPSWIWGPFHGEEKKKMKEGQGGKVKGLGKGQNLQEGKGGERNECDQEPSLAWPPYHKILDPPLFQ